MHWENSIEGVQCCQTACSRSCSVLLTLGLFCCLCSAVLQSEYQRVYLMQQLQQAAMLQQQMAMATFTGGIPGQQGFPGAFLGNPEGEEEEDESTEDEGHAAAASAHAAGEAEVSSAAAGAHGGSSNPHQQAASDAAAMDAAAAHAAAAAAGMPGGMDMSGMLHPAELEQQMLHQAQGMDQQGMGMGVPHPGDHGNQQQPEEHPGAEGVGLGLGLADHQHHNAVAGMDGLGPQGLPPADSAAAAAAAAAMGFHPQGSADLTNAAGLGTVGSVHHDVHGIPVLGSDPAGLQGGPDPHGAVHVSLPQVGSHGHLAGDAGVSGVSGVQDMAATMVSEPQELMDNTLEQQQQLAQQVSQLAGDITAAVAAAAAAGAGNGMPGMPGVDMGGQVQHDLNAAVPGAVAEVPKPADLDVEEMGVVTEEEMEAMSKEQLMLQLKLVQEELLSKVRDGWLSRVYGSAVQLLLSERCGMGGASLGQLLFSSCEIATAIRWLVG